MYGLPTSPPRDGGGLGCIICSNQCIIGSGSMGYCGLRLNVNGRFQSKATSSKALLYAYKDPHVTNCCAAYFCPAGTGLGYPKFAYTNGPEYGYYNYAVFFYGCNFSCLYCQNFSHKNLSEANEVSIGSFIRNVVRDQSISCICYFGGSPEPSLPFAIAASRRVLEECCGRIVRICFEWNGCGNRILIKRASELSLISGGNIKFDLKCFDERLSIALSGVSNRQAYENFKFIAEKYYPERRNIPVLNATTLLVPEYVNVDEVEDIASFISEINDEIPYSLLVFYPNFMMVDMPITPLKQVIECYKVARKYLKNVYVGNLHLIGFKSMHQFQSTINNT
jgi:pyruvate formate lyase activating enzyme